MKQAIWRWIKRTFFGIAALSALLVASLALLSVWERHRLAEFNRTHERPLADNGDSAVLANARALLARLKLPATKDSLRFVVMPSFGKRWFAVSLASTNGRSVGEAVVTTPSGDLLEYRKFDLPQQELRLLLSQWDEKTDGYTGEGRMFTDGNPLAFERIRGARISSGTGNSPCHYDVLGDLAAHALTRYVPELEDLRDPMLPARLKNKMCNRALHFSIASACPTNQSGSGCRSGPIANSGRLAAYNAGLL